MIQFIEGTVEEVTESSVVINHDGIGFEILVPQSVLQQISVSKEIVRIYTYFNVREDAMQLFGFLNRDDRTLFKMLITVSGIGPKGALGILGVMSADEIRFAILADDAKAIAKAPGIGAKTAGKVILELKDKLQLHEVVDEALSRGEAAGDASVGSRQRVMVSEAVEALEALGYSATEAMRAVKAVSLTEEMTVDELLRQTLTQL